jgi:hypothetical protein
MVYDPVFSKLLIRLLLFGSDYQNVSWDPAIFLFSQALFDQVNLCPGKSFSGFQELELSGVLRDSVYVRLYCTDFLKGFRVS